MSTLFFSHRLKIHLLQMFAVLLFCSIIQTASSQSWVWAQGEGGPGSDAAKSITVDEQGNTYITGNIAGFADFSGTTYQGRGIYDIFIAKYNSQGGLLWVKLAGGDNNESGNAIQYKNGFLYLTGYFNDTTWFGGNRMISRGSSDAFIAKYDKDGSFIWVKQAGGVNGDLGISIDVDDAGDIFVAGTFRSSMTLDAINLTSPNFYDESFYARYDANGNVIWAKATRGNNPNQIAGVAFDHDHSFFITGFFGGNFTIGSTTVNSSTSSYDIFLAKIDANGDLDWLKKAGSTYEDAAHGVCSDLNGNPSIVGYFAGTAYFDSHTVTYSDYNDVFVARYDSSGNNLWVRAGRGHQLDVGWGIATDNNGNVFATGMFQDYIDFDGNIIHVNNLRDIFLVSYTPNGDVRWLAQGGGLDTEIGFSVAVANSGLVAICGYYTHTCYFGNLPIDYAEVANLFIANYNQPLVNGISNWEDDSTVSIYPNPSQGNYELRIANYEFKQPLNFTIRDLSGRKIVEQQVLSPSSEINLAAFEAGIYFITVEGKGSLLTKKIIKE